MKLSKIIRIAALLAAAQGTSLLAQQNSPEAPTVPEPPNEDMIEMRAEQAQRLFDRLVNEKARRGSVVAGYKMAPEEKKALRTLEDSLDSEDKGKVAAALAAARPHMSSPNALFVYGALELQAGNRFQDSAMQSEGTDLVVGSGAAPEKVLSRLLRNQASFAMEANDLPKAEGAFAKLLAMTPADADTAVALAQIKADLGKHQEALGLFSQAIAAKTAAGQEVPALWLRVSESVRRRAQASAAK
ncbi:MAG TPA: hypothetical protein VGB59_06110 [Allosphingosinicella sp.]|jgi:tetratricopeptide (TPR) repeat protein